MVRNAIAWAASISVIAYVAYIEVANVSCPRQIEKTEIAVVSFPSSFVSQTPVGSYVFDAGLNGVVNLAILYSQTNGVHGAILSAGHRDPAALTGFSIFAGSIVCVDGVREHFLGDRNHFKNEGAHFGHKAGSGLMPGVLVSRDDFEPFANYWDSVEICINGAKPRSTAFSVHLIGLPRSFNLVAGLSGSIVGEASAEERPYGYGGGQTQREPPISPLVPAMVALFGVPSFVRGFRKGPTWVAIVGFWSSVLGAAWLALSFMPPP